MVGVSRVILLSYVGTKNPGDDAFVRDYVRREDNNPSQRGVSMMDIPNLFSRRNLLAGIGGAAATVALAEAASAQSKGKTAAVALATATYEQWSAQIGSNFTAHTGQVLRLSAVTAYAAYARAAPRPAGVRNPGFVATLDIVRGAALPSGLYLVAHPTGGTFEVYLTKGGPNMPLRMLADFN